MGLKKQNDDFGERADAAYMSRIDRNELPEPFPVYNESANGGRWWEDDLKEAALDLYGEPTIYN